MNADNSQLLAQLIDIHAAPQPGWWPPAPGWWVLALALLLLLAFLRRRLLARLAVGRRRRAWFRDLDRLLAEYDPDTQPQEHLAALNRLFRAVALKAFPDTACARLQGEEWVQFIFTLLPDDTPREGLAPLAHGPYQAVPRFDAAELAGLARTWIRRYG